VPITRPEQWAALIRRCTLNDRDMLLREMAQVLHGAEPPAPVTAERLTTWDTAVAERFAELLAAAKTFKWPLPLLQDFQVAAAAFRCPLPAQLPDRTRRTAQTDRRNAANARRDGMNEG